MGSVSPYKSGNQSSRWVARNNPAPFGFCLFLARGLPRIAECALIMRTTKHSSCTPLPSKMKHSSVRIFAFVSGAAIALGFPLLAAHAAPLTFTTAGTISLTSPSTTLTVATGSVADSLLVNATSVAVSLSNTTGGSFTLLSPSINSWLRGTRVCSCRYA